MKEIVPKDSRYVPFTQQKSCCVPTCISMIMYKNDIPLIPLELLGYHLGLIVDKKETHLFWNVRTGERPPAGYGTRVSEKIFEPNRIFRKLKIPLKMELYPIESFKTEKSFVKFIKEGVEEDLDVLVCFNHGVLKGTKPGGGHVCVIDKVYPKRGHVRLIDPSPLQPKWRIVDISLLKHAMEEHSGNSGGFWEFNLL